MKRKKLFVSNNEQSSVLLTDDLALMVSRHSPEKEFHKRMVLSFLPPPVANMFGCHGHHATAYDNLILS